MCASHSSSCSLFLSLFLAFPFPLLFLSQLNVRDISCGAKCLKLLVLVFNTVFWFSGLLLFCLGIFVLVEDERALQYKLFTQTSSYALQQYLALVFIGIGASIFVIGFCGCCGSLMDSKSLLLLVSDFIKVLSPSPFSCNG